MADFARSSDPAVQHQLDRLAALSPGGDVLGLDRITRLLARLGDPHRSLPPVFHVAGTNGKGSTCAFLRAAMEAAGLRVHVYTSPHLVRFNERIRIGGTLIQDTALAALLAEVFDACGDIGPSFFEVTTAAAFLAFARNPADACVVEVGLGGRLDATNVLPDPAAAGIAALGLDHQVWLGHKLKLIAREKAGIAKLGRPLVTLSYDKAATLAVQAVAKSVGAQLIMRSPGHGWSSRSWHNRISYMDDAVRAANRLNQSENKYPEYPLPSLPGKHQHRNYMLAVALLRHQDRISVPDHALQAAATGVRWPARLQRLSPGPLTNLLPQGTELWLDGGHNEAAGRALAVWLSKDSNQARPRRLVLGMLQNKDAEGFLAHLAPLLDMLVAVPIPGHDHHSPADLARLARRLGIQRTDTAPDLTSALPTLGRDIDPHSFPPLVLIAGSLYLAGEVLQENGDLPS